MAPNLVLLQHAGFPPLRAHIRKLSNCFWIKHLSLNGWSPLISDLDTEASDIGNQKTDISRVVSDFFESVDCKPQHIIRFCPPSLFPAKVIQFHLFNLPFHNSVLCNNLIIAPFQEFTSTFSDNCNRCFQLSQLHSYRWLFFHCPFQSQN